MSESFMALLGMDSIRTAFDTQLTTSKVADTQHEERLYSSRAG